MDFFIRNRSQTEMAANKEDGVYSPGTDQPKNRQVHNCVVEGGEFG